MTNGNESDGMSTVNILDTMNLEGGAMCTNDQSDFMRKFSRELGRNRFNQFKDDLAMAGITWKDALVLDLDKKEVTWKDLMAVYRKIKMSELHRMRVEVAATELAIARTAPVSVQQVVVINCTLTYKDESGNNRSRYITEEVVSRKHYEEALNEGRLTGAVENDEQIGRVEGYTDVMDIDIEDFNNIGLGNYKIKLVGQRMTKKGPVECIIKKEVREKVMIIEHGHGIIETISMEAFLDAVTDGSNTGAIRYLNDAEIKYGNSQEGYGAEHADYNNAMSELIRERMATANSLEYKAYVAQQMEERKLGNGNDKLAAQVKNAAELKDLLLNAKTHQELFKAAEGKLFPKKQDTLYCNDPNDGTNVIHKGSAHDVWVWTSSAVTRAQRTELMAIYKDSANYFRMTKEYKLTTVKDVRESAFKRLLEVEGTKEGVWALTPEEAFHVKGYAQDKKRETGVNVLSNNVYSVIATLAARKVA